MRSAKWVLAMLAVTSAGLVACSSDTVTDGTLSFNIAESLLVLYPDFPTTGFVLLSSGTGNCAATQAGVPTTEVGNVDYVVFPLGQLDANGANLPLTGGNYTIVDPSTNLNSAGLFAFAAVTTVDNACDNVESDASSGTVTVSPFDSADGGSSSLAYVAVFGNTQISGTGSLTTCLVSVDAGPFDGACHLCVPAADGGACAIQ
jgi:hypothetical protein